MSVDDLSLSFLLQSLAGILPAGDSEDPKELTIVLKRPEELRRATEAILELRDTVRSLEAENERLSARILEYVKSRQTVDMSSIELVEARQVIRECRERLKALGADVRFLDRYK